APDQPRHSILTMDEPEHMRVREPLAKALYRRVAASRPLVQRVVDEWLDRICDAKSFDVMDMFAIRVPIDVIARILGVDETRLTEFRDWSEGAILGLQQRPQPLYARADGRARGSAEGRPGLRHDDAEGRRREADRRRDLHQSSRPPDRRQPHDHRPYRQCDLAADDASGPADETQGRSFAGERHGRGSAAL